VRDAVIAVDKIEIESGGLHMIMVLRVGDAVLRILLDGDRVDDISAGLAGHRQRLLEARATPERLSQ
jgi:hypothetical protein